MTATSMIFAAGGESVDAVAARIGAWCRDYPEKELCRTFHVAIQTVRKWRRGEDMPAGRHLVAMAEHWGPRFVDSCFSVVFDDATFDRRLQALETSLALLRQDLPDDVRRQAVRRPAPEARGVARPGRPTLAAARALIVGIVLGAGALHLVPQLPDTVAGLAAVVDDVARVPRGTGAKAPRAMARAASTGRREG